MNATQLVEHLLNFVEMRDDYDCILLDEEYKKFEKTIEEAYRFLQIEMPPVREKLQNLSPKYVKQEKLHRLRGPAVENKSMS